MMTLKIVVCWVTSGILIERLSDGVEPPDDRAEAVAFVLISGGLFTALAWSLGAFG